MNLRDVTATGSASGVARLVLVAAALVGFLLMHGVAATDPSGSHHATAIVPGGHGSATGDPAPAVHPAAGEPGGSPAHDAVMAGCVFVLIALGGLALRALRIGVAHRTPLVTAFGTPGRAPARAPPCQIFVCLCVFRL